MLSLPNTEVIWIFYAKNFLYGMIENVFFFYFQSQTKSSKFSLAPDKRYILLEHDVIRVSMHYIILSTINNNYCINYITYANYQYIDS